MIRNTNQVPFIQGGRLSALAHRHSHDEHNHTHEHMTSPQLFTSRPLPIKRTNFKKRAFTVGIGGPVGSGKTALVLALCELLRNTVSLCVVTNDIFTREDWEFLVKNKAIEESRMEAVETGGCPHAAIREDISMNIEAVCRLTKLHNPHIVFLESGGDNLAANFSRELADYTVYVIDVSGGDKIPRKGGPGITQSDLVVINKTDLAVAVGASLEVMEYDSNRMRQGGPVVFSQVKNIMGVNEIADYILTAYCHQTNNTINKVN